MNPSEQGNGWTRVRWMASWLAAFGVIVGFIVLLSRPVSTSPENSSGRISMLLDYPLDEAALDQLAVADPALFVLPNARGFSGAWMEQSNFTHRLSRWEPPDRWLQMESNEVGVPLFSLLSSNRPSVFTVGRKIIPDLRTPLPRPLLVETNSLLELSAVLTNRLSSNTLPARLREWNAPDVLRPSAVQVMVNPAGLVLTARILERSGWPRADENALALARSMRFAPTGVEVTNLLTISNLITGTLTFHWATRASAVTNITPARLP